MLAFFPRLVLGLIGLAVLGAGGIFLFVYSTEKIRQHKINKIHVIASYNEDRCNEEYPILIVFTNKNRETIKRLKFNLAGLRRGYSDSLYWAYNYSTDKILSPGAEWASCWRIPPKTQNTTEKIIQESPPKTLLWEVSNLRPDFE